MSQPLGPRAPTPPPRRWPAWLLAALLAAGPLPAAAEIYHWLDEGGAAHFADNLHSVPEKYRRQLQTRSSDQPAPGPAAREIKEARPSASAEIPLEKRNGGYVARALLNGRETARLIVDTGATSTILSPSVAARLGVTVRWDPPVLMNTVGGATQGGWADLDSLSVGGREATGLRVIVYEVAEGVDGLLGMDFLNQFRVEIHGRRPSLVLSPP